MKLVAFALALLGACGHSPPAPVTPQVACVDPIADTRARLVADDPLVDAGELALSDTTYDLDGDGAREHLVEVKGWRGVTGNQTVYLYLSDHRCAHFAGVLFGESIDPLATSHRGVRDLATYADGGCASLAGTYDVFEFDGRVFQPDAARRVVCACPEDGAPDPARDPQCPGYE